MNLNQKIIPQLNNYLILHNIANELSLWKKTFITEAEQVEYSQEEVKFDNVIELRKNYRGNVEIIFKEAQNDVIVYFGYRAPLYFKFIGWTLVFLTLTFFCLELFVDLWGFFLFILTGSTLLIFGLLFVFIIAKCDFKREILLPDQRDELMAIARKTQINQITTLVPEKNYTRNRPFPSNFTHILILQNIYNLNDWRNRFLDLLKENGYFIRKSNFFNYLQVIKDNRHFVIGFKIDFTTLFLFVGYHRHFYYYLFFLGTSISMIVSLIIDRIYDLHYHLFLNIAIVTLLFFIGFLIYYHIFIEKYDSNREMAAPKYIDELMHIASISRIFESKDSY